MEPIIQRIKLFLKDTINGSMIQCFVHQRAPTRVPPLSIPPVPEGFPSLQIEGLSSNKAKGIDSLNVKLLKVLLKTKFSHVRFSLNNKV